ncbi:MAG TPA: GNAT family N-acetyltransferase [Burkholderiales bacterium]|nr:GNAT family N-acetyltransferase [Burkholderiales bacterium]
MNTSVSEPIESVTERLRMRQWRGDDREPFARLNADPRVMAFFPKPLGRLESDAMAERIESRIAENGWGFWAVERLDNHEFIGFVGLNHPAPELPCSPCVEVGWRLAFEHWGKGYATEAATRALKIGFASLGLAEIVAFTPAGNVRSRAVMERLGMRETGGIFDHPHVPDGSGLRQHCLYRLTRADWASMLPDRAPGSSPRACSATPPGPAQSPWKRR